MSKLPRMNVIERQVATANEAVNKAAEVTGEELATVQGGRGFPDMIMKYGAPRPRDLKVSPTWKFPELIMKYGAPRPRDLERPLGPIFWPAKK